MPASGLLALGLAFSLAFLAPARALAADEASVKAALLYNLMPFIVWPLDALPAGTGPRLCLHDEGALLAELRKHEGKPVQGQPFGVRRVAESPEALRECHAVFIEGGNPGRLARAAAVAAGQPLLVVGEGAGAVERGAMIGIVADGGRVAFEINLGALRGARINASSHLLRLARNRIE